jgi:multidrug resistance efflux pump
MNQETNDHQAGNPPTDKNPPAAIEPRDPVKRWTIIVLAISVALVFWYLRADRVTPMTSQARVHARVVPVAPEVSGTITVVLVSNNQVVEKGQELFQIDASVTSWRCKRPKLHCSKPTRAWAQPGQTSMPHSARLDSARANQDRSRLDTRSACGAFAKQDPGAISQRRLESAEASLPSVRRTGRGSVEANLQAAIEQLGETGDEKTLQCSRPEAHSMAPASTSNGLSGICA